MAALVAATGASGCTDSDREARRKTSSTTSAPAGDNFPGVWPFTSAAEAEAYVDGPDTTYLDPVATARSFMEEYAGMTAPVAEGFRPGDNQSGEVEVRPKPDSPFVTTVLVRRVAGAGSPWMVVGTVAGRIQVTTPVALERVSSPVTVSGRSSAFEGTVVVQVKEDGMGPGDSLGQEPLIGGAGAELEPFTGAVPFRAPRKTAGAVVFLTESAEDGSIEQVSVVRVRFERTAT